MVAKPEEMLEIAKKLIGKETKLHTESYPVEYEPIRRWCQMSECDNPLFLDPEYAKKTKHGEVVCPPFSLQIFGHKMPGYFPPPPPAEDVTSGIPSTPGSSVLFLGSDWEFFKPVKVGDRLSAKDRLADFKLKAIRFDPKARWIRRDSIYYNQNGEKVAVSSLLWALRRSPEEVKEAGDA
jgi:acyl dehydratase